MAKLERVTGKVFGGSAPLDQIGQFGSAKAGTPTNTQDVATIQSLPAYSQGWGSAILTSRNFPPIEEVTGVLKTISYQNCYLLQEGVPEYDVNTEYSSTSIVKLTTGVNLTFYRSLIDNNIGNPLSDGTAWAQAVLTGSRNVGEIIPSLLPLNDSSVHLLDGTLINGNGIYKDFVDYIANIYNSSLNYFCTEEQWQTSVNTYGSCGKFVYNSTNNTVRLPKISDILQGTTNLNALGDLVEAGLPNIDGTLNGIWGDLSGFGAFSTSQRSGNRQGGAYGSVGVVTFNASASNPIYGNSNTVQPQTIKVLYYIVVATSTKIDIQVDIDNIVQDLGNKADTNLSNISPTQAAIEQITAWGIPDYTAGVVYPAGTFTAVSNGLVTYKLGTTGQGHCSINGSIVLDKSIISNGDNCSLTQTIYCSKGDTVTIPITGNFYPMKGTN